MLQLTQFDVFDSVKRFVIIDEVS